MIVKSFTSLFNGKLTSFKACELQKLFKRDFPSPDEITIPLRKVLVSHSPVVDLEVVINGEWYIQ